MVGVGECDGGQDVDEFGGQCGRHAGHRRGRQRCLARPAGLDRGRGQVGQDPPPGGDTLADEHAEPEGERAGACVQGGVTKLFVLGVQAGARPALGSKGLTGIQTIVWFSSRTAR